MKELLGTYSPMVGIGTFATIALEDNVRIGANSTVCGGVTIGADTVIGGRKVIKKRRENWICVNSLFYF